MSTFILVANLFLLPLAMFAFVDVKFEKDTIKTSPEDLQITFIGHGTLMFQYGGKTIHVDPVGIYADYSQMPKADLILVTHEHSDHLDKEAIRQIAKADTALVLTANCAKQIGHGEIMKNGDAKTFGGIKIEAVPAYNLVHLRSPGQPYHPKGVGNGYVITCGDTRVYVAGDSENIPEMANLSGIDIAFLPMNVPYTMTPEMAAKAVKMIKPRIVYPYHFGDTDTSQLVRLLEGMKKVEVRIRKLK